MKKILYLIVVLSIVGIVGSSCRVRPINGDLDGHWQLMIVETPHSTINPQSTYYAFYRHIANLRPNGPTANLTYDENTNCLTLDFPEGCWIEYPDTDNNSLEAFYIPRKTPCTLKFKIIKLTSKQLIMTLDDTITYTFRKF